MVTRTGDREIGAISGRLPDNPGELACMQLCIAFDSWGWRLQCIAYEVQAYPEGKVKEVGFCIKK